VQLLSASHFVSSFRLGLRQFLLWRNLHNTQPGNWGVPKDLCQCSFDSFNDLATFEHASPVSLFASPLLYDAGLQGSGPTLGLLTAADQFAQQDPPFIASDTIHQSLVIHKDATVGPVRDGTPSSNSQGSSPSVEDRYLPRSAYTNSAKGKVSNRRGKRKDQ